MRKNLVFVSVLLALCVAHSLLLADIIYLNTGGHIKGKIIERNQDSVVILTEKGIPTTVLLEDIEKIEEGGTVEEIYQKKLSEITENDADGHYKLGMWLKNLNMTKEALEEFKKAIIINPEHEFARAELGYVKRKEGWIIPKKDSAEEEEWVFGVKSTKKVQRKALVLDPALLKILPQDIVELLSRVDDKKDDAGRKDAYAKLAAIADAQIGEAILNVMKYKQDSLLLAAENRQREILRLLPGQTNKDLHDLQVEWFEKWDKARLEALDFIYTKFDKTNLDKVNELVKKVKELYIYHNTLLTRELSKIHSMSAEQARNLLSEYEVIKKLLSEIQDFISAKGGEVIKFDEKVTDVYRAILNYRSENYDVGELAATNLSGWELHLFLRVVAWRILKYNDDLKSDEISESERGLVKITNDYRMEMGRLPLEIDIRLCRACKKHSEEMARLGYFSHTSPTKGRETPQQRAELEGYKGGVGENIYSGSGAGAALKAWFTSPGHHRNMLGGWDPVSRGRGGAAGDDAKHRLSNDFGSGWRTMGAGCAGPFVEQFGPLTNLKNK